MRFEEIRKAINFSVSRFAILTACSISTIGYGKAGKCDLFSDVEFKVSDVEFDGFNCQFSRSNYRGRKPSISVVKNSSPLSKYMTLVVDGLDSVKIAPRENRTRVLDCSIKIPVKVSKKCALPLYKAGITGGAVIRKANVGEFGFRVIVKGASDEMKRVKQSFFKPTLSQNVYELRAAADWGGSDSEPLIHVACRRPGEGFIVEIRPVIESRPLPNDDNENRFDVQSHMNLDSVFVGFRQDDEDTWVIKDCG